LEGSFVGIENSLATPEESLATGEDSLESWTDLDRTSEDLRERANVERSLPTRVEEDGNAFLLSAWREARRTFWRGPITRNRIRNGPKSWNHRMKPSKSLLQIQLHFLHTIAEIARQNHMHMPIKSG
jgi:hypothetical protein